MVLQTTNESEIYAALGLYDSIRDNSNPPRVLSLVSMYIERLIRRNESLQKAKRKQEVVTIFHGCRAPSMSIREYIERIYKYTHCSPSSLVLAYVYINKFLECMDVLLTSLVAHRVVLTGVMVAAKFIDDECFNNAYYAKVGGVSTAELNRLEMKFLFALEFKLNVTPDAFKKHCLQLETEAAGDRAEKGRLYRGSNKPPTKYSF